jgi:hypothetical protein
MYAIRNMTCANLNCVAFVIDRQFVNLPDQHLTIA